MKAFISYSHRDSLILERLHTHLAHLKREGEIISWTDNEIPAGSHVNSTISRELDASQIFIALLSPDYIASNYCYEIEFQKAMEMHRNGKLIIVPIIIEPCDWLNTPFSEFKALPKDGKPLSTWENINTAFLDVTQNIRKLLTGSDTTEISSDSNNNLSISTLRNYRVKKDFDSIQKLEFTEKTYKKIVESLKRYIEEINALENIKTRISKESPSEFECMLVNRNKIATECLLKISINSAISSYSEFHFNKSDIKYVLNKGSNNSEKGFSLSLDDYHLFWEVSDSYFSQNKRELTSKEMANQIWEEWLKSVDIYL